MTSVLVIGAGGHALVCIEALTDSGFHVVGCVSRDGTCAPALPVRVLGLDTEIGEIASRVGVSVCFVAVGHNATREGLHRTVRAAGLGLVNALSRFAMVSPSAALGDGVLVAAGAVVNAAAVVGDGVILNTRCSIDHEARIGSFAHVSVGVSTGGAVRVGERALVGLGASLLPGVQVGDDAVIGAGAVVVGDVAPGSTVVGVPARPRR